jgi:hypothetical protein
VTGRLAILVADLQRNEAGIAFRDKGVGLPEKPVPVFLEAALDPIHGGRSLANIIGQAKLSMHNQVVWADVDWLEHRLGTTQFGILYPHPWGEVKSIVGGVVEDMVIDAVGLMVNKPQDPRIGSLRQQGWKSKRAG